jgi:cell division cycle 14
MSSFDRELRAGIEILPGRLFYVAVSSSPPVSQHPSKHFFSIDNELVYWNFFLDFGPLNLGHLFKFCAKLNGKLSDPQLKDKVIYFYSGTVRCTRGHAK